MRLATVRETGQPHAAEGAAVVMSDGLVPIGEINACLGKAWTTDLFRLIERGLKPSLLEDAERTPTRLSPSRVRFGPLYRRPRTIWGIGLNYREHAEDLSAPFPAEPASFMKGDHTIIGPGDHVLLPPQSHRVTAEAELGLVIGRTCRNVSQEESLSYLAGVCLVLDMTAEDILARNPRFLTRAKNFDTFLSIGPELITMDEVPSLPELRVGTYKNGKLHRENVVSNMAFSPDYLVAFHSHVGTLNPGDIILTGTPGAVVIEDGDTAECRIEGLGELRNPARLASPSSLSGRPDHELNRHDDRELLLEVG